MDNKRKIGEEELKRALLMMKYDSKKTLTENINEVDTGYLTGAGLAGAGTAVGLGAVATAMGAGATAGSFVPGLGTAIGAAVGATIGIVLALSNNTGSADNTIKIIKTCTSGGVGSPSQSDSELEGVANQIYTAIEGLLTDEDAIKNAISSCDTFPDFCRMSEIYLDNYNESLVDALDGDFDFPGDWQEYIYTPLKQVMKRTKVIDETKLSASTTTDGGDTTGGGEVVPVPSVGKYKACEGTYTQGCYSDAIKQIQTCLDLVPDGKYGPKTQAALEGAGFGSGFKDSDVDKICQTQTMPEPDMDLPTPDEDDIDSLNI
jgi:hypothetical protein